MKEKTKMYYFKQPKFYSSFHCIGNECPVNCCFSWGTIGWKNDEYKKLIEADMSRELRDRVGTAFSQTMLEPYKRIYPWSIQYNKDGKCPMLTEDGLCAVQKELGEGYLSHTCRAYPRVVTDLCVSQYARTCQNSCTYVMEILCSREDSMELVETSVRNLEPTSLINRIKKEDVEKYPHIEYANILFDFFYEILSDKTRSVETSIVLGAIAAKKIDDFIIKGYTKTIPEIIKMLKPQLNNPVQIEKLEKFNPNISLKAKFATAALRIFKAINTMDSYVFENGIPNEEKWIKGVEIFHKKYKPFALRNVALNLYISNAMPFNNPQYSLYDNFRFFVSEYAIMKYLAVTSSLGFESEPKAFEIAAAYIDRGYSHSKSAIEKNLELMDKLGITSPAYLMGILK